LPPCAAGAAGAAGAADREPRAGDLFIPMNSICIYMAAPVFSQVERLCNRRLAQLLERELPGAKVILPQDFRSGRGRSFNDRRQFRELYRYCLEALDRCDVMLARLDGPDADSGTAFEVGYAVSKGKPVLGLRTDYRQLQSKGLNVMLAEGCTEVMCRFSFDEKMENLARDVAQRLLRLVNSRRKT